MVQSSEKEPFLLPVKINGKDVKVFLDSGSQIDIISPEAMRELDITHKRPAAITITTVDSAKAGCEGITTFNCFVGKEWIEIDAFIVPNFQRKLLFGRETMFKNQIDVLPSNSLMRVRGEWFDRYSLEPIKFPVLALADQTIVLEPHAYNHVKFRCPLKRGSFVVKMSKKCAVENLDVNDIQVWVENYCFTLVIFHRNLFLQEVKAGTVILEVHPPLLSTPGPMIDVSYLEVEPCASDIEEIESMCVGTILSTEIEKTKASLEELLEKAITNVPERYRAEVIKLFERHSDVVSKHRFDLGLLKNFEFKIRTNCRYPIVKPVYRASPGTKEIMKEMIENMLKYQIIRPSSSPWSSNSILVKKPDDSSRFCNDFRDLNAVTVRDTFPIPRIDDITDYTAGAKVFSSIDLTSGFWQISIEEGSREKTAFSTPFGKFEYCRMAMGLTNGPPTFQACMQFVLGDLLYRICIVYLDDILVYSQSFEDHMKDLDAVLTRLKEFGVKIKLEKCRIGAEEIRYLGHKISKDGLHCCEDKVETVKNIPLPINAEEVLSYLGLVQYYRRFVEHCSIIAAPLYELMRKDEPFVMDERRVAAFNKLKEELCKAPVMMLPNFRKEFWLAVDASNLGFGGVLKQLDDQKRERVIAYASCALKGAQANYHCTDLELLAVKWGIEHFRPYLTDKRFVLFTDHKGLLGKRQLTTDVTGKRTRWLMYIFMFDFEMRYKPGKLNGDADALSRLTRGCDRNC